jgi:hypothetical protein
MRARNRISLFILAVLVLMLGPIAEYGFSRPRMRGANPELLLNALRRRVQEKRAEGYDVSEVIELAESARAAFKSGDKDKGMRLLKEAMTLVRQLKPMENKDTVTPTHHKPRNTPRKTKTIELAVQADKVVYTLAVPKPEYEKGSDIKNFDAAFETRILKVADGKVSLQLDDRPVFLEVQSKKGRETLSTSEDSPFGIHSVESYSGNLSDLGVKWVRLAGPQSLIWALIEPKKGKFNFSKMDGLIQQFYENGINLLINVNCFNFWDQYGPETAHDLKLRVNRLPKDLEAYSNFLQRAAERYDGDGVDDAPGSPIVRYWQIMNEVDGPRFWHDSEENYAKLLRISYRAIKKADKNSKVVLSGFANYKGFYDKGMTILKELNKLKEKPDEVFFDVFDLHWSAQWGGNYKRLGDRMDKDLKTVIRDIHKKLEAFGYGKVPIWITEMSNYSGSPIKARGRKLKEHSESEHAASLLKSYIYSLAAGVKKIFWVTLKEWHNFGNVGVNNYFDSVGLINNPRNDGESHKKLAYYSYKLMAEKLEGSDWNNIETLDITSGVFACKFTTGDKDVYVLWYD